MYIEARTNSYCALCSFVLLAELGQAETCCFKASDELRALADPGKAPHVNTYIYIYTCIYIHTDAYMYTCMYIYTYQYMKMYVCINMYICIIGCVYIYIYIYMYIYIYVDRLVYM